jgi:putative two-component system response regulator
MMIESLPCEPTVRILVVDDTPENIHVLRAMLAEYHVTVALSGQQALELLKRGPFPNLILLDVMMPGMDGFELCAEIKKNPGVAAIPVIFVTAMAERESDGRGFAVGGVDYITKPISAPVLRARVATHVALARAQKTLQVKADSLEELVALRTLQVRQAYDQVRHASVETVLRLSQAAEFKDEDTGTHVLRMSRYCASVARKLDYPEHQVELLLHASPMHDIGKIGIPDRILLKPGKLTADEWAIMKQHTTIGAKILAGSNSEVVRMGETIASSHHEKWDGTGYPRGLKGDDIPWPGLIAAIGDVFDALTSRRPYKDAFSVEKAFQILREGRGSHFAPDVVDAFFAVESEILETKAHYQDSDISPYVALAMPERFVTPSL